MPQELRHPCGRDVTTVIAADQLVPPVLPSYARSCRQRWLVLPGWDQGASHWAPVARQLAADGIMLLCPDMAELAGSCPSPPGSLDRLLELTGLLAECCNPVGISVVIGHSSGAPVAVLLAHRLSSLRSLVLVEPMPYQLGMPDAVEPATWAASSGGDESVLAQLRNRHPFAGDDTLRTVAAELVRPAVDTDIGGGRAADVDRGRAVYRALSTLPVEVSVLRGAQSAQLTAEDTGAVVRSAPTATEYVVSGAGHSAHLDQPRAVAVLLRNVIAETVKLGEQ